MTIIVMIYILADTQFNILTTTRRTDDYTTYWTDQEHSEASEDRSVMLLCIEHSCTLCDAPSITGGKARILGCCTSRVQLLRLR